MYEIKVWVDDIMKMKKFDFTIKTSLQKITDDNKNKKNNNKLNH